MPNITQELPYQPYTAWNYAMGFSKFASLSRDIIMGTLTGYGVQDFFQENSDYFVAFTYYPFPISRLFDLAHESDLVLGKQTFSSTKLNSVMRPSETIANRKRPVMKWFSTTITRRYNNFLDYSPYTKISLTVPFFESINIDTTLAYTGTLDGYLSVDLTSNHATLYIYINNKIYDIKTAQMGVSIPIGKTNAQDQKRNNVLNLMSLATGITTASMGNTLASAGGINLVSKTMQNMMLNQVDRLTGYKGGTGTLDTLHGDKNIYLVIERPYGVRTPDVSLVGKPTNATENLSTITGFTVIGEINFNPMNEDIYDDEIEELIDIMHTGFIL